MAEGPAARRGAPAAFIALTLAAAAAAQDFEPCEPAGLGVAFDAPAAYIAEVKSAPTPAATLSWDKPPWLDFRVVAVGRRAMAESAAVIAGLYARRAAGTWEIPGESLTPEDLAARGAEEGLRVSCEDAGGPAVRNVRAVFLAAGRGRWFLEVSYPVPAHEYEEAAAERVAASFRLLPDAAALFEDGAQVDAEEHHN